MGKKRLKEISVIIVIMGAIIGSGLFSLALGLYVYWVNYFDRSNQILSLWNHETYFWVAHVSIGVLILLGSVIAILGGLMAFRVKVFWWRIASILLFVSLFLPWWQWSLQSFGISYDSQSLFSDWELVSAHNFLFGFLRTSLSAFNLDLSWDIRFIPYLTLESGARSSPFDVLISGSWLNSLLVRTLCYLVFGPILLTSILGWSKKKKRRLIGVIIGSASIILFVAWLFLALSAFGLGYYFGPSVNPYFLLFSRHWHSFLSLGFFTAVIGVIILTVSLFMKDLENTLNVH